MSSCLLLSADSILVPIKKGKRNERLIWGIANTGKPVERSKKKHVPELFWNRSFEVGMASVDFFSSLVRCRLEVCSSNAFAVFLLHRSAEVFRHRPPNFENLPNRVVVPRWSG